MKKVIMALVCGSLMLSLSTPIFAKSVDVRVDSTIDNQQGQGQSQATSSHLGVSDAFKTTTYNIAKDNVSVGGWLHASGSFPGMPDIPLDYRLTIMQYNESSPTEIFAAMPDSITREMISVYKETLGEEVGWWDEWKMERNTNGRSFKWAKYEPTNEIIVRSGYPNSRDEKGEFIAKKGVDYKTISRIVFNSEEELVYREDLAFAILEKAMDQGANTIIVTGFGARRIFTSSSTGLSMLSAFGQVFTNAFTGAANISPGIGYSAGSNQTETLPYLRVTAVHIVNPVIFDAGYEKQPECPPEEKEAGAPVKTIIIKK